MNHRNVILTALAVACGLIASASAQAGEQPPRAEIHVNWKSGGRYVLVTNDFRSIQAYYQDVGVGPLLPAGAEDAADLRESCLTLGKDWRVLGYVLLPVYRSDKTYRLDLCYLDAPNSLEMAAAKCANLGLRLEENRPARREIVCGRETYVTDGS